jgi:dolichol-phosphate mannosyltransferase
VIHSRPTLSIVIPTLDEAANIGRVVRELDALAMRAELEVIVVDDGSRDGTPAIVEEFARARGWLKLVRRTGTPDLSGSVVDGWRVARGTWLGVMDGDLQHPGEIWSEMLERIEGGTVDLVVGSRFAPGADATVHAGGRSLVTGLAVGLARTLLGGAVASLSDPMSGMFAVRASSLDLGSLRPMGYKILLETLVRSGITRVADVAITFRARETGASKAGLVVGLKYLAQVVKLWTFVRFAAPARPELAPASK